MREWLKNNADHPLAQLLGGKTGDAAALYRQADAAATSAYNGARNAGLANDAAREASYDAYQAYLKQGRGDYFKQLPSGGVLGVKGPGTVKIDVGTAGLTGSGGDP